MDSANAKLVGCSLNALARLLQLRQGIFCSRPASSSVTFPSMEFNLLRCVQNHYLVATLIVEKTV